MNGLRFLITALFLLGAVGCATTKNPGHPPISKLLGIWEGQIIEADGTIKKWRQIRTRDGEYVTFFGYKYGDGEIKEFIDIGKWWDEKGHFHEINPKEGEKPYIYSYEFYKPDCIRFVQTSKAGEEPGPYTFTECKVEEAPRVGHASRQV